ncbi:MAG: phosphatidate cytidylyltransferase [Gammaproteobacteria bacterium]
MLKSRIITATLLIITVLAVIFYAPPLFQAAFILLICLVSGHEWLRMIAAKTPQKILFYDVLIFCAVVFYYMPPTAESVLWFSVVGWIFALAAVIAYQKNRAFVNASYVWRNTLIGLWLIVPMFASLFLLLTINPTLLIFLLILIWSCDIFAFFAGRRFGKHLLASRVSPGKSIEGAIGAFIGAGILAFILLKVLLPEENLFALWILSLVIIPVTIIGDLFESVIKRIFNIKDSGQILPGHGGALDRLDSLTAAAPIFAFVYFILLGSGI